jgi:hypothetical protein
MIDPIDRPASPTRERARLAALTRHHPDADHGAARRDLRAAQLEEHIRRVVDQSPPLTENQKCRLALILRGSSNAKGATPEQAAS